MKKKGRSERVEENGKIFSCILFQFLNMFAVMMIVSNYMWVFSPKPISHLVDG